MNSFVKSFCRNGLGTQLKIYVLSEIAGRHVFQTNKIPIERLDIVVTDGGSDVDDRVVCRQKQSAALIDPEVVDQIIKILLNQIKKRTVDVDITHIEAVDDVDDSDIFGKVRRDI